QYLLTADLTPGEIIVGKCVARLAQVGQLVLCAIPLLCFVGVFGGVDFFLLLVIVLVTALPAVALGPISLLTAVWSRPAPHAVLGVYAVLIAGYLVLRSVGGLNYFNPMYAIEPLWQDGGVVDVLRRLPVLVVTWTALGLACLALAAWRLRPAYTRQLQGDGRARRQRWWLARRAAGGDETSPRKGSPAQAGAPRPPRHPNPRGRGPAL